MEQKISMESVVDLMWTPEDIPGDEKLLPSEIKVKCTAPDDPGSGDYLIINFHYCPNW